MLKKSRHIILLTFASLFLLSACIKNESKEVTKGMSSELSGTFKGTLWLENGEHKDYYTLKVEAVSENKIKLQFKDGSSLDIEITVLNDYMYQNAPDEETALSYYAFVENKRLFLNNLPPPALSFNGNKE